MTRAQDPLEQGFRTPPPEARLRCYWWWLNGHVTKAGITRDLEAMKAKGYGGAIIVDAGGAEQRDNLPVPAGPLFASPAWRDLYRHALAEASRLGLELSLNILSGWNLGGPTVKPEHSAKLVTSSRKAVTGPVHFDETLPMPPIREGFYRDVAVLAYPLLHGGALAGEPGTTRKPIRQLDLKGSFKESGFSTPDSTPLLMDFPSAPGEQDTLSRQVLDLTAHMNSEGHIAWDVPAGDWEILRFGYTSSGSRVSTSSGAWQGLVIDYIDHTELERYWKEIVDPLLEDAKPYRGKTLAYLVTDSWELNGLNWTPRFADEFRKRRGYDLTQFLPVLAGRIVDSREISGRFLNDLRRTVGDLVADEHYGAFAELAKRSGLGIHPESGGPHGAPIDALQCLGRSTFPQMEFWAKSPIHRVRDEDRFFVKEAASAAHIYGKTLVAAEGFTTIGPHWQESLWADLKPTFDRALCEGLNRHIWHTFTSSPAEMGLPGQEYFAGTHFNPNVTWWNESTPFLIYLNRGQFLMQQGQFVADVLYYYGNQVPDFVRLKASDPARVLPGYDYDVTNEEILLQRLQVKDRRLLLPGGMTYRVLVLPDLPMMSLAALKKIRDLVSEGATAVGRTRPERTTGLEDYPRADAELKQIVADLWGDCDGAKVREHRYGRGRFVCGMTAREVFNADRIPQDFEWDASQTAGAIDYIHRRMGGTEIYFISNQQGEAVRLPALFRVAGKAPELWDAEAGEIRKPAVYDFTSDGRTKLTLHLRPYGSAFVLFREPSAEHFVALTRNGRDEPSAQAWVEPDGQVQLETAVAGRFELRSARGTVRSVEVPALPPAVPLDGPWRVGFEAPLAVPQALTLNALHSLTEMEDPLVKYFSGTAVYTKEIQVPPTMLAPGHRLRLDLGRVGEIAEVILNGTSLGIHWSFPFVVDVTAAARPGANSLEIRVTNLWANRVIGDAQLPPDRRFTQTNITQLKKDTPLLPSGLIGPVALRVEAAVSVP
jgi:hypothetical protein